MSRAFWSDKEVEILQKMARAGKTPQEVVKVLKSRTITSIQKKASDQGISFSDSPEIDFDAFKNMMKNGRTKCL